MPGHYGSLFLNNASSLNKLCFQLQLTLTGFTGDLCPFLCFL
eukprot:Gb_12632 [translate_table: standard]